MLSNDTDSNEDSTSQLSDTDTQKLSSSWWAWQQKPPPFFGIFNIPEASEVFSFASFATYQPVPLLPDGTFALDEVRDGSVQV